MFHVEQDQQKPLYVRFGTRENQEIPLEWAEKMLTELKEKQPKMFGKLLQKAIGIE